MVVALDRDLAEQGIAQRLVARRLRQAVVDGLPAGAELTPAEAGRCAISVLEAVATLHAPDRTPMPDELAALHAESAALDAELRQPGWVETTSSADLARRLLPRRGRTRRG